MKKKIAVLFSMVALFAFIVSSVSYAQSPRVTDSEVKVEKTVEKKSGTCCDHKGEAKADANCCASINAAAKKTDCQSTNKTCGGCPSKSAVKSADVTPVPKK